MNAVLRARSTLLAGSMILGGICIFLGHLLNVNSAEAPAKYVADISAHHAAFIAGSVIVSAGAFLVIAAMVGAMRLAPGRGGTLVTIGAVLACISAASLGAGTLMLGIVMGMLTPAHAALAVQVAQIGQSGIGSLPFTLAPGLVIGPVLVAIGLYRARLAHRWLAILLGVAVVPSSWRPAAACSARSCISRCAWRLPGWESRYGAPAAGTARRCLFRSARYLPPRPDHASHPERLAPGETYRRYPSGRCPDGVREAGCQRRAYRLGARRRASSRPRSGPSPRATRCSLPRSPAA